MKINYKDSGGVIAIDTNKDIPIYSPVCSYCSRLDNTKDRGCEAFKVIPLEIWLGDNDHKKPFEGDNGIIFQANPKLQSAKNRPY